MKKTEKADFITSTISLEKATLKKLHLLAIHREMPVRDLIREAISEYLKRQGAKK
jgi:hypothetical protein